MALQILQKVKQEAVFWLARRLPTCQELAPWMSQALERELTLRERVILRLHFLYCVWCLRYQRQLFLIRDYARRRSAADAAGSPDPAASLSPEARERLKRALNRQDQ